jgi:hypothetical protein
MASPTQGNANLSAEGGPNEGSLKQKPIHLPSKEDKDHMAFRSLEDLLARIPLCRSINDITATSDQRFTNVWDEKIVGDDRYIILPKNIEDLCKTEYLYALYVQSLYRLNYKFLTSDKEYTCRLPNDSQRNIFLKAFGLILTTGQLPKIPSNAGTVRKGISSSLQIYAEGQEGIDKSLYKIKGVASITEHVLGTAWGQTFKIEKKILDHIIHAIRVLPLQEAGLHPFLKSIEVIKEEKGLNLNLKSELITNNEQGLIKAYLNLDKIEEDYPLDLKDKDGKFKNEKAIKDEISERQKSIRKPKSIIKKIVSSRLSACYAPLSSLKKKEQDSAKKLPILKLKERLEGTTDFSEFNPTRWFELFDLPSIPGSWALNASPADLEARCLNMYDSLVATGVPKTVVTSVLDEFYEFISKLRGV